MLNQERKNYCAAAKDKEDVAQIRKVASLQQVEQN
jgi:hypothetical protein